MCSPIVPSGEALGVTGYDDFALYSTSIESGGVGNGIDAFCVKSDRVDVFVMMDPILFSV